MAVAALNPGLGRWGLEEAGLSARTSQRGWACSQTYLEPSAGSDARGRLGATACGLMARVLDMAATCPVLCVCVRSASCRCHGPACHLSPVQRLSPLHRGARGDLGFYHLWHPQHKTNPPALQHGQHMAEGRGAGPENPKGWVSRRG